MMNTAAASATATASAASDLPPCAHCARASHSPAPTVSNAHVAPMRDAFPSAPTTTRTHNIAAATVASPRQDLPPAWLQRYARSLEDVNAAQLQQICFLMEVVAQRDRELARANEMLVTANGFQVDEASSALSTDCDDAVATTEASVLEASALRQDPSQSPVRRSEHTPSASSTSPTPPPSPPPSRPPSLPSPPTPTSSPTPTPVTTPASSPAPTPTPGSTPTPALSDASVQAAVSTQVAPSGNHQRAATVAETLSPGRWLALEYGIVDRTAGLEQEDPHLLQRETTAFRDRMYGVVARARTIVDEAREDSARYDRATRLIVYSTALYHAHPRIIARALDLLATSNLARRVEHAYRALLRERDEQEQQQQEEALCLDHDAIHTTVDRAAVFVMTRVDPLRRGAKTTTAAEHQAVVSASNDWHLQLAEAFLEASERARLMEDAYFALALECSEQEQQEEEQEDEQLPQQSQMEKKQPQKEEQLLQQVINNEDPQQLRDDLERHDVHGVAEAAQDIAEVMNSDFARFDHTTCASDYDRYLSDARIRIRRRMTDLRTASSLSRRVDAAYRALLRERGEQEQLQQQQEHRCVDHDAMQATVDRAAEFLEVTHVCPANEGGETTASEYQAAVSASLNMLVEVAWEVLAASSCSLPLEAAYFALVREQQQQEEIEHEEP